MAFLVLAALLSLLVICCGCGDSGNGDAGNGGKVDGGADSAEFDRGFAQGRSEGYARGYSDGKQNAYNPSVPAGSGLDDGFNLGYEEGWAAGYDEGYEEGLKEAGAAEAEMAELEAAMLAFVRENAAPGLEFRIENIVIHGDEAAGIAVCVSQTLETPLIVMRRDVSGWYGIDFGTGIEPPSWYYY